MLLRVFIGYDPVESVAWHVMAHSIFSRSSLPVAIIPVNLKNLKGIYNRNPDSRQSNEFSFSRFLVPFLSDFNGVSLFFDCDMLMRVDVAKLLQESNIEKYGVSVVKHDYSPRDKVKYLNNKQHAYPRKNWSSVVVWNCSHPSHKILTPSFIDSAEPSFLHRFSWLKDDEIGELDVRWNWLVGEYDNPPLDVNNVHWTVGGPYFHEYQNVDFSEEWFQESKLMSFCKQRE
jgi:hypothetical protein